MFDRLSIRHKLAVLLGASAALALLISSLITVYSTYVSESQAALRALQQLSRIISENMRAALAFHDPESAANLLAPLKTDPHILLARVSEASGLTLSEYRSPRLSEAGERMFKQHLEQTLKERGEAGAQEEGCVERIDRDFMGVMQPIFFDGRPIGTLALIA
ncbi:MAG: hypothetical protein N2690_05485, partial [Rhodocyclaceae bacterium]|nr:hypothetical protein [Rhodocyclaceae bacterium]